MSFLDIQKDFASITGVSYNDVNQRNLIKKYINDAALDIYTSHDPQGCLREQLFILDLNQKQVTLPWYIYKIRGVREYEIGFDTKVHDMRPRYSHSGWHEQYPQNLRLYVWRVKTISPTSNDISNEGFITFTIPEGKIASVAFNIIIVGGNEQSSRFQETISFPVGANTVTSTKRYNNVDSISKNALTEYDLNVTDIDGNNLGTVPASEYKSRYTIIQISDVIVPASSGTTYPIYVEVLYKIKLSPLRNDYDEFPAEGYDKAIFWKSLFMYYSTKKGEEAAALAYDAKCSQLLTQLNEDASDGTTKPINFAPNGLLSSQNFDAGYPNWGSIEYPGVI